MYPKSFWETYCFCFLRPFVCPSVWPSVSPQPACPAFTVKLLGQFQLNFTGVISINLSFASRRHVPLCCTKWPPEIKIGKACPAFTSQTTGLISTKLYRSDHYQPQLCMQSLRSAWLHKMVTRAAGNRKPCPAFTG